MTNSTNSIEELQSLDAIQTLSSRCRAAALSGDPDDLTPLITDDFVYYQPSFEGPCTYGKQAHVDYVRSLPKVHRFNVQLFDSIQMGRWVFEAGEEHYEESAPQDGRVEQVARFARLLHRADDGSWQIARVARGMALDLRCARQPPAPERIANGGRGRWQPRQIDVDVVSESEWLIAADQELMRRMLCDGNAGHLALASRVSAKPDHLFVSTIGNYTWKEYENDVKAEIDDNFLDDLQRHNEDARVIVPGKWAYSMGKGIVAGILDRNGEAVRYGGVHAYLYLWQRIDNGRDPWPWKIRIGFTCDMVNPFRPMDPENPLRSDIAHKHLEKQRRSGTRQLANKFAYLNADKS